MIETTLPADVPEKKEQAEERIVSADAMGAEKVDNALRPKSLGEFIGQEKLREKLHEKLLSHDEWLIIKIGDK